MTRTLAHRGPDQEGFFEDARVSMGFRRLSILDLSAAGNQPMEDRNGRYVMIFNGEIFNYLELRNQLISYGHAFQSSGDAEVLLTSFIHWGSDCVRKFNGMFAFIIYDRVTNSLFGARDRFGIKPLYFSKTPSFLLFSSEIKGLRRSGMCGKQVNESIVSDYFMDDLIDASNETFFEDVQHIPAGHRFFIDPSGTILMDRYWDLESEAQCIPDPTITDLIDLLDDAVRIRMRSDVQVGVSLSGGLDSTSIICAMARQPETRGSDLLAFTFESDEFDETEYIRSTIQAVGATLIPIGEQGSQFWNVFEKALHAYDEPVHSMTPLVGYKIFELAAKHGVKVVLGGQGADEVFGGYASYCRNKRHSLIRERRVGRLVEEARDYVDHYGGDIRSLLVSDLVALIKSQFQRLGPYRKLSQMRKHQRHMSNPWFSAEYKRNAPVVDHGPIRLGLAETLIDNITESPLPIYLRVEDRNSMAHSVEARLPFLDYRLVLLAARLDDDMRVRGATGKIALRKATKNRIPETVRTREDKMGFPIPWNTWFREGLYQPVRDLIENQSFRERGIYDIPHIRRSLALHREGKKDYAPELFKIIQYELWQQIQKDQYATNA